MSPGDDLQLTAPFTPTHQISFSLLLPSLHPPPLPTHCNGDDYHQSGQNKKVTSVSRLVDNTQPEVAIL